MKRLFTISFIILLLNNASYSQDEFEMWYKLSPEIRLNIKYTPWEFRLRPDDHIILPKYYSQYIGQNHIGRTDVMLGANIWKFKLFSYSKFDYLGSMWTGARFDFNTSLFNKKLLINIQERLFFGLNEESDNHYYLVQFIRYKVAKKIQAGVLSYGKWKYAWPYETDEEKIPFNSQHWFIGPTANFVLPYNFNIHVALTKSIFYERTYMTFIRLGYRIYIERKNKKEEYYFFH